MANRRNGAVHQLQAVIAALGEYEQWMKKDLIARSQGDFRLGSSVYAKKLLFEEMVDIPLDRLLAIGEATLERDHQAFVEMARRIDPSIPRSLEAIAKKRGWSTFVTENAAVMNPDQLKRFDLTIWNNTSGDVLTTEQRAA
jgi:hypothetical protein